MLHEDICIYMFLYFMAYTSILIQIHFDISMATHNIENFSVLKIK